MYLKLMIAAVYRTSLLSLFSPTNMNSCLWWKCQKTLKRWHRGRQQSESNLDLTFSLCVAEWEVQLQLREVQEGIPSNNRWAAWVSTSTEGGGTWNMIFIWDKQPGLWCLRESQLKADLQTPDWMLATYDFLSFIQVGVCSDIYVKTKFECLLKQM